MAVQSPINLRTSPEQKHDDGGDDINLNDIDWNRVYLFQDVVFRASQPNDVSELVNKIVTPSFDRNVMEFKFCISRKHKAMRYRVIQRMLSLLMPYFMSTDNHHTFQSFTFYNKNLDISIGHLLLHINSLHSAASFISYMRLLWMDVLFWIPWKIGIECSWRLMQIHCAQKLIHFEFQRKLNGVAYQSIEMMSVVPRYHKNGYGSYMIQQVHRKIYGSAYQENNCDCDCDKSLPVLLTFTATPHYIHFYEKNGYKLFLKIFVGVELTYYGFLYHGNASHLNEILTAFATPYEIDFSFWKHMFPRSCIQRLFIILIAPFIMLWIAVFSLVHIVKDNLVQ